MKKTDETGTKILIVDDDESILRMIDRLLSANGYTCTSAASAAEARGILAGAAFDLLLCDMMMPEESGMDFISYVLAEFPETAVIMVTGMDDPELAEIAMEVGAYGYIIKPFKPAELLINISNALRRRKLEVENRTRREELESKVLERTKAFKSAMDEIVRALAMTAETRDPYTAGHQMRVAALARAIAIEMSLANEIVEGIHMAGMIHDLGKISIPSEILTKPTRLTDLEFSLIKTHPMAGHEILKDMTFPWPIAQIVLQHHEKMDGSGYPNGLSGDDILMESRIIAVADVVEAMASHRPYRPALGIQVALEEISKNKGSFYDPEVVESCMKLFHHKGYKIPEQ